MTANVTVVILRPRVGRTYDKLLIIGITWFRVERIRNSLSQLIQ